MYSNVRKFWVEPHTGVVVDRLEQQNNTLDYQGTSRITTTQADARFTPKTVKENTDKYGPLGEQLNIVRNIVPVVALVLGVLLLVAGIAVGRRPRRGAAEHPHRAPVAAGR
jgi:hypothetical protein